MELEEFQKTLQLLEGTDEDVAEDAAWKIRDILDQAMRSSSINQYLSPAVIDKLFHHIKERDWGVVEALTPIIGYSGDIRVVPPLIELLRSDEVWYREGAAAALINLKQVAIPALLELLEDGDAYVRGKSLAILAKLLPYTPLAPLIARLSDEACWVREVAGLVLHQWGFRRPKELFTELAARLLRDLDTSHISEGVVGNLPLEYVVRLLFSRRENSQLEAEFAELLQQLRRLYEKVRTPTDEAAERCKENIINILEEYGGWEFWTWSEELRDRFAEKFKAPPCCWTCALHVPRRVPLEEVLVFVQSEDYEKFCRRHELEFDLLDPDTGQLRQEALDARGLHMVGYCPKHRKLVYAGWGCEQHAPREWEPPITDVSVDMGGRIHSPWVVVAKVDGLMYQQLGEWVEWLNRNSWEPDEAAKTVRNFLKGAAISSYVIYSDSGPKSRFFFTKLIRYSDVDDFHEVIFEIPPHLWTIERDPKYPPFGAEGEMLDIEGFEYVLRETKILTRVGYLGGGAVSTGMRRFEFRLYF